MISILAILFLPSTDFFLYITCLSFILLVDNVRHIQWNEKLSIAISLLAAVGSCSLARSMFLGFSPRDYFELGRFLPMCILLASESRWSSLSEATFFRSIYFFCVVDFILCAVQITDRNSSSLDFSSFYSWFVLPVHLEKSYLVSARIPGFSPGPGQQGLLAVVMLSYFLSRLSTTSDISRVRIWAGIGMAGAMVLASQSQTAFIAALAIGGLFLALFMYNRKIDLFSVRFVPLVLLALILVLSIDEVQHHLSYLATLFVHGTARSSFLNRLDKWNEIVAMMDADWGWILIGYGKEFFGKTSAAMDSEYIYLLAVYGIWFAGLVYAALFYGLSSSFSVIFSRTAPHLGNSAFRVSIGFSALIFSIASSFFTDPKVLTISCLALLLDDDLLSGHSVRS